GSSRAGSRRGPRKGPGPLAVAWLVPARVFNDIPANFGTVIAFEHEVLERPVHAVLVDDGIAVLIHSFDSRDVRAGHGLCGVTVYRHLEHFQLGETGRGDALGLCRHDLGYPLFSCGVASERVDPFHRSISIEGAI